MKIINAKIYTMENEVIENGYLCASDGKITEVAAMEQFSDVREDAIDARGMSLFPGFVDAHCHLGMWEDGLGFEGDDGNEATDPSTPHLRAIDAINPRDHCFEEALRAGIT
ncbi:MAG: amidohydrolase, partial [Acetanaerobacterium sp.]